MRKVTKANALKSYKVFNKNWQCNDFQYEVGKTYLYKGDIKICKRGYHACPKIVDCFNYYEFNPENKIAEVLLWGDIDESDNKLCASRIKIVKEITWEEMLVLSNSGYNNTGYNNIGHSNSGHSNTGHYNSGHYNSGHYNSGHSNSGYNNIGHSNSGNRNSGNYNSGYNNIGHYNSGNYNIGHSNSGHSNTGHYNSGNYNSGLFNTNEPTIRCFNQDTSLKMDEINPPIIDYPLTIWVSYGAMTDKEKETYPNAKNTDGYLKSLSYHEMWTNGWADETDSNKILLFKLPNFNMEIFKEITGLDVTDEYNRLIKF